MRLRSLSLTLVVLAAAMVNVLEFRSIDQETISFFRAWHRFGTGDVTVQMRQEDCDSCRERYDPHLALATIAPAARVIVPVPSRYARTRYLAEEWELRLRTFGDVSEVDWVTVPAGFSLGEIDLSAHVVASGPGGRRGAPWLIAADPSEYRLEPPGEPDQFLDRAQSGDAPAGPPGRTFVLVSWGTPRPGSTYSYQDLLVEVPLLPEAAQRELLP